jgi:penicillin amidase
MRERGRSRYRAWRGAVVPALAALALGGCGVLAPLPAPTTLEQRLAAIPAQGLPLRAPVTIHWNDRQVPFIEASHDDDLAVALGVVHAHLRLGQMEVLRRVAQGRLAEMAGPLALDIDRSLRILGPARAAPEIYAAMPAETRRWLESFVAGVNHYLANVRELPHEFAVLGLAREPWRPEDVIAIGRLASADVNWLVWFQALRLRGRPDWPELWQRLVAHGAGAASAAEAAPARTAALAALLAGLSRSGSNSLAVSARRSASGGALLASDPHVGIYLPSLWLVVGYRSPSHHAVGLMGPGLPIIALGRNPRIAWGGTNLHAASSDLYDVASLPPESTTSRRERIKVRWWFETDVTVRFSPFGPIVSDAPLLEGAEGKTLALRWLGHSPSDELTALLKVSRARGWDEFRAAFAGFAVPGETMVYADADGHVGKLIAATVPRRPPGPPPDFVQPPAAAGAWDELVGSRDLPAVLDPPQGFVVSANDRPEGAPVPLGYIFSPEDRYRRMSALLAAGDKVDVEQLSALQRDVLAPSALKMRDRMIAALGAAARGPLVAALAQWDGRYAEDSAGALAFELLLHHFVAAFYDEGRLAAYLSNWRTRSLILEDMAAAPAGRLADAMTRAAEEAAPAFARLGTWGEMHRLRLAHPLGQLPLVGRRYRFADLPAAGNSETVMKTAHGFAGDRHGVRYGSTARHVSDLADPDANYFVLLGGQDGWINSSTFSDQLDLWRRGGYVRVPLGLDAVRRDFARRTVLRP